MIIVTAPPRTELPRLVTPARWVAFLLFALCLGGAPQIGAAQQPPPDKEAAKKAKEHFARGASHFYKEEYDQAVVEFLNAYDYYPDPMILYNLARAHAKLDSIKTAIQTAEKAQRMGGMPKKATARNAARIAAWKRLLTAREISEDIAGPRAQDPRRKSTPVAPPPDAPRLGAVGWTGVGLTVVGAGLVGYAGYVELDLDTQISNYKKAARNNDDVHYRRFKQDIADRQQVGKVSLYTGLACLATGVGLWSYDLFDASEAESSVTVDLAPSADGPSVGFSFSFE